MPQPVGERGTHGGSSGVVIMSDQAPIDAQIQAACQRGAFDEAATLLLETYGDELLSFLAARLRSPSDADEAFSIFVEDVWVGLPQFAFRSSARTWAYTLARNAASRYARSPSRRAQRNLPLSGNSHVFQAIEQVRSRTRAYLRTEVKDRLRALREKLDPDDQTLLILRVDRGMSFRELARVMLGDSDEKVEGEELDRESVRLRKRFERVKAEFKQMVKDEGLLEDA